MRLAPGCCRDFKPQGTVAAGSCGLEETPIPPACWDLLLASLLFTCFSMHPCTHACTQHHVLTHAHTDSTVLGQVMPGPTALPQTSMVACFLCSSLIL